MLDAQAVARRPGDKLAREDQQVSGRMVVGLLPQSSLVPYKRDARHALRALVRAREIHDRLADALLLVVERHAQSRRVAAHARPVTLEGKRLPAIDTQRGEDSPAHQQADLPG